jgi:hypothetical protein
MSLEIKGLIFLIAFGVIYIFVLWIWTMICACRLMKYLKKNEYDRWLYLHTLPWGGSGDNPFRALPFYFSNDEKDDQEICRLKHDVRRGIKRSISVFISICVGVPLYIFMFLK